MAIFLNYVRSAATQSAHCLSHAARRWLTRPDTPPNGPQVYDITNFAKSHPGGTQLLALAVGRDATARRASAWEPFVK